MYEYILVALVIAALLVPKLISRFIPNPYLLYLKISVGVGLLTFAWLFEIDAPLAPKFLLSLAVLYGCIENYKIFKKEKVLVKE